MKSHIVLIVDRSGSMETIRREAEGGANSFIREHKNLKDLDANLLLVEFDNEYHVVYDGPLAKAPAKYKLQPRGMTALRDAIGKTLGTVKDRARRTDDKVSVSIITDGMENASREWSDEQLKKLMKACRKRKWHFDFMMADEETMHQATRDWGFATASAATYTPDSAGITRAYASVTNTSVSYLSGDTDDAER